ncbi:MAG: small multi-drug export protein [Planctomycetaceae bacterium]
MNRITSQLDLVRADDLHTTEGEFRRRHPLIWAATLYGPVVLTVGIIIVMAIFAGWDFTRRVATATTIALFLLGRFIILSGSEGAFNDTGGSLTSGHLFAIVTYLDVITALVLAFHIGFLFKVPYLGPRIAALVTDGHFILDAQPWMRRATFFGLIAFVGFPLAATGSIGGSIFGRLLGMGRIATFFGIMIGTLLGNGSMYFFSDLMGNYIDKDNPYLKYGGFALIAALVIILERRYRKLRDGYAARVGGLPSSPAPQNPEIT